ncbi:hypothetical protein ACHAWF_009135 [Thalassiosira exigua]
MEDLKDEVRDEAVHSLKEWGVKGSHEKHSSFRQRAIRDCLANLSKKSEEPINYAKLNADGFPENYKDAYEHVLRDDDVPSGCYLISSDRLKAGGPYPPYRRWYDRISGEVVDYKLRKEFKVFPSDQIESMTRFQFRKPTPEEILFERWFVDGNDAADEGVLFEAILACHALQSESCYNCKCKTLRWNGGGAASWQDLVCINPKCRATYEIKTKADLEKVEKAFQHNNINGGSFSAWCQLRSSKQAGQKAYIAILPRTFTVNLKLAEGQLKREKGEVKRLLLVLYVTSHTHSNALSFAFAQKYIQ